MTDVKKGSGGGYPIFKQKSEPYNTIYINIYIHTLYVYTIYSYLFYLFLADLKYLNISHWPEFVLRKIFWVLPRIKKYISHLGLHLPLQHLVKILNGSTPC